MSIATRLAGLLVGTALLAGCTAAGPDSAGSRLVYVGTQDTPPVVPGAPVRPGPPPDPRPGGKGIYAARLDEATGRLTAIGLVAELARPTWLLVSPTLPVLYSVSETGNDGRSEASVHSFAIGAASGALRPTGQVGSGGGGATHLAIDPAGRTMFVANYGNGRVGALPVAPDGGLLPVASVQADRGTGPKPRQHGPHAHAVLLDPSGRILLAADLGADRVFLYRFDPATRQLAPATPPAIVLPPGSGPRHLAFTPDGRFLYLDTELSAQLFAYRWDAQAGIATPVQTLSTVAADGTGERSAAELAVARDGRFLYVSNRGEDSLAVFGIDRQTGMLTQLQRLPAGGKSPWSFTIDPTGRWVVVCNQGSSLLTVLKRDPATGLLSPTGQALAVPKAVNVAFYPN